MQVKELREEIMQNTLKDKLYRREVLKVKIDNLTREVEQQSDTLDTWLRTIRHTLTFKNLPLKYVEVFHPVEILDDSSGLYSNLVDMVRFREEYRVLDDYITKYLAK